MAVESRNAAVEKDRRSWTGFYLKRIASLIDIKNGREGEVPAEYRKLVDKSIYGAYQSLTELGAIAPARRILERANSLAQQRSNIVNS